MAQSNRPGDRGTGGSPTRGTPAEPTRPTNSSIFAPLAADPPESEGAARPRRGSTEHARLAEPGDRGGPAGAVARAGLRPGAEDGPQDAPAVQRGRQGDGRGAAAAQRRPPALQR